MAWEQENKQNDTSLKENAQIYCFQIVAILSRGREAALSVLRLAIPLAPDADCSNAD